MNNEPTVKEHYIPRCYLKQFTINGEQIYQLDLSIGKAIPRPVSIKSICYEDNLYEFKDESGDFKYRNLIENKLSIYEREFAKTFYSIRMKATNGKNFGVLSFLTSKEKCFLIFFLATMIVRNPDTLQAVTETTVEYFDSNISDNRARNLAIIECLPLYKKLDYKEKNILNSVIKLFENMSFQICVTNKDVIYTSDKPVILLGEGIEKIKSVYLPLSPRIFLKMLPYSQTKKECRNRLVALNDCDVKNINRMIVSHSKRWVYSKNSFTKKEIKLLIK